MGKFVFYKESSRANWGVHLNDAQTLQKEDIKIGAILRIADSLERIEKPYLNLIEECKTLREQNNRRLSRISKLEKQIAAYKGIITKMKKMQAIKP